MICGDLEGLQKMVREHIEHLERQSGNGHRWREGEERLGKIDREVIDLVCLQV